MSYNAPTVRNVPSSGRERRDRPRPWHKWYKTARWERLRQATFLHDLYTCRKCGQVEGNTAELICDHIQPHRGDQRLFWDPNNLQTLCIPCHNAGKQKEEQASLHQRGIWY